MRVPASDLRPNPRNWRTHPAAQADALRGVLAEVGFAGAELARRLEDGTLMLIDGHLRAEVSGTNPIPVLVLDVNEAEADKLLATFDPLGAMAEADVVKLNELLHDVETGSQALADMLTELAEEHGVLDGLGGSGEVVEDEVPEPPVDPITKPGDLWLLGEHRLLCGDSTKADDVARLMGSETVECIVSDPPYGIQLDRKLPETKGKVDRRKINGDADLRCAKSLFAMIDKPAVIWGANCFPELLPHRGRWICWDKRLEENADRMLGSPFELAWTNRESGFDKIIRCLHGGVVNADGGKRHHPTQKPVKVFSECLNYIGCRISAFDPFLGSGTTLIAAEQLGRKCYGMEISPQYCDVIVKRWETLTGKKAVLEQ